MEVTNPQPLIDQIPLSRWEDLKGRGSIRNTNAHATALPDYVHPAELRQTSEQGGGIEEKTNSSHAVSETTRPIDENQKSTHSENFIQGKIQKLGDFVDTDAVCCNKPYGLMNQTIR